MLAKPIDKRNIHHFDHIPYLNSLLFEIHPDENNGIKVSNLVDGLTIDYYAKIVVKDANNQRKKGKASTLPYLLEFLDAFDFANDCNEEVVSQSKDLICASVLGLIFEKISGYKDGSFYSPSITPAFNKELSEYVREYDVDDLNKELGFAAFNLKLPRATHDMFGKQVDEKTKTKKRNEVEETLKKAKEIENGAIYQSAFE